jgi:large subunit ribosomal protein L24
MPGVDIRKNDNVIVIAGKDRGKQGRVVRVMPQKGRIMVDGVALAKKHSRAAGRASGSSQALQQGGIIDVETYIDISNVSLVCKKCNQLTRVGHPVVDGVKVRICRKCEAEL